MAIKIEESSSIYESESNFEMYKKQETNLTMNSDNFKSMSVKDILANISGKQLDESTEINRQEEQKDSKGSVEIEKSKAEDDEYSHFLNQSLNVPEGRV